MKLSGYVILQAEALKCMGPKGDGLDPQYFKVYNSKESAREWLMGLIRFIKKEQGLGLRTRDNLDPKKKLDFYIQKVTVRWDDAEIRKRGWKIPK